MSIRSLSAVLLLALAHSSAIASPGPTPTEPTVSADPTVPTVSTEPAPTPALATAPASAPAPKKSAWRGFRLASDDDAYRLRIGGQLQVDTTTFPGDDAKVYLDEVRLRRARLQVRATTARHFDFRLLLDFADARVQILDAVFETTFIEELRFRIGKDKSPVSFDRLQSSTALHFLERTPTPGLAPNRDLGIQLAGKIDKGLIDYQLGLWDGTADGATVEQNPEDDFDFAGRVTFQPFINAGLPALKNLQLGVAGSFGSTTGTQAATQLATYRTSGRATWFRYASGSDLPTTAIADGDRVRLGGHLLWTFGPVHLFGELIQSSQEVTLADRTETITNLAYGVQASWVLTGEDASWSGLTPTRAFDPSAGALGALELAVRWGETLIDDLAFDAGFADENRSARRASTFTAGLNWYLDAAIKLQLNVELTSFENGAAAGADRDAETLIGARGQFLF